MKKLLLLLSIVFITIQSFGQATGYDLSNFASSGSIGTASTTVDVYSRINIIQTTPSISLTVPKPTNTTTKVTEVWITNKGTASFNLRPLPDTSVFRVDTGQAIILKWIGAKYSVVGKGSAVDLSGYMPKSGGTFTGNVNGVTPTELGYVAGATSNIQTQINGKQATFGSQSANLVYRSGDAGGIPTFSSLSISDLPTLTSSNSDSLINQFNIDCYGDSETNGKGGGYYSYPQSLQFSSGRNVYNFGINDETSTQIRTRFLAASSTFSHCKIIWAGRNNFASPTTVKADIAAMVAALGHTRYVVMGVTNSQSEPSGSANYNTIVALNSDLAALYGANFFDVRTYIISQYNPSIPQDVTDHTNDVPPTSLMSDPVHFNSAGYKLIGTRIFSNYISILTPVSNTVTKSPDIVYEYFNKIRGPFFKDKLTVSSTLNEPRLKANIVVNGTFPTDLSSWTAPAGWSWTSGGAQHTSGGGVGALKQTIALENGITYYVQFDVSGITTGGVTLTFGSLNGTKLSNTNGTQKYSFVSSGAANFDLTFTPSLTFNGTIDNVIVQKLDRIYAAALSVTSGDGGNVGSIEIRAGPAAYNNYFTGTVAGGFNYGGYSNTFVGNYSGEKNITGYQNLFGGGWSGNSNISGSNITALGFESSFSNQSGIGNTYVGSGSGRNGTTASRVSAFGVDAARTNNGADNSFFGYNAGIDNSTAAQGAFFGSLAGVKNTTGTLNSFFGYNSGGSNISGGSVSAFGNSSGQANTASGGCYFGAYAGSNVTSGGGCIMIGRAIQAPSATTAGQLNIGNVIYGLNMYNSGTLSSTPVSTGMIGIRKTTPTEALDVAGNIAGFHLIGSSTAPKISAGTGAGTAPTVTISGTDLAGQILVTTGTSPETSAVVATVTFNTAYSSAPRAILISPGNQLASTANGGGAVWVEYSTISTTGFELKQGTAGLNASAPYVWYYTVIQ